MRLQLNLDKDRTCRAGRFIAVNQSNDLQDVDLAGSDLCFVLPWKDWTTKGRRDQICAGVEEPLYGWLVHPCDLPYQAW